MKYNPMMETLLMVVLLDEPQNSSNNIVEMTVDIKSKRSRRFRC